MEELLNYLLKASFGIAVFYSVYWFFLRKETLFRTNRIFLLSSLLLSLILPFISINYTSQVSSVDTTNIFVELNRNISSITNIASQENTTDSKFSWIDGLMFIYLTGAAIFFLRILFQSIDLLAVLFRKGIKQIAGLKIVENDKYGLPFSFFNIVYINPKFHTGTDLTNILAHEKVHIRENHWFDLLLVEVLTILFWFNPFVWLFERSIKQNHEYLADEGVLAQGFSIGRYQAILVNQLMGMQIIGITNNLNYSLNKKRMKMMTKMKTPKTRAFKMIWALPAVALILLAFAEPEYVMETKSIPQTLNLQNTTEQTLEFTGKVVDESGTPLSGASIVIYGGTKGTTSDNDGLFTFTLGKTDKIFISYVGFVNLWINYETIDSKLQKNPKEPITFTLVVGAIKLDIDEIISKGKPKEEVENRETIKEGDEVFVAVEELPSYPGGIYAFAKEIKEKIGKLNPSDKVIVDFTVNKDGSTKYLSGQFWFKENNGPKLVEIIKTMQNWTPGMQRGKAVPVTYSITLNYK
ncbi:MAG: M56 family metallopeptidase [Tenuifilaceae bacterium]